MLKFQAADYYLDYRTLSTLCYPITKRRMEKSFIKYNHKEETNKNISSL